MSEHEVLAHVDEYLAIGIEYDCSDIHLPTAEIYRVEPPLH